MRLIAVFAQPLWYLYITVIRWTSKPSVTDVVIWLENQIGSVPSPAADLTYETYPRVVYSAPEVELEFTFVPRRRTTAPTTK